MTIDELSHASLRATSSCPAGAWGPESSACSKLPSRTQAAVPLHAPSSIALPIMTCEVASDYSLVYATLSSCQEGVAIITLSYSLKVAHGYPGWRQGWLVGRAKATSPPRGSLRTFRPPQPYRKIYTCSQSRRQTPLLPWFPDPTLGVFEH